MRPYGGLAGIVARLLTDGSVNEEAAAALAHHLLANGAHGLVVAERTAGEAATLTDDEQVRLVKLIVGAAGDEGTIVSRAGSEDDTRHAVELTERIVAAGAHVLLRDPYYNKPNRGSIRHFEEVAEVGGTPVILYNIPGRTAVNMPPGTCCARTRADRRHRGRPARRTRTSCS